VTMLEEWGVKLSNIFDWINVRLQLRNFVHTVQRKRESSRLPEHPSIFSSKVFHRLNKIVTLCTNVLRTALMN
jgi:hypothetical protein